MVNPGDRFGRFELDIATVKNNGESLCDLFAWLGFVPLGMMYHQARESIEWRGFSQRFDMVPVDNLAPLYRIIIDDSRKHRRYEVERLE